MQKYLWSVVLVAMAVSLSFGVATATAAKGGNSANAKLCQKGGWMDVQGSDGTQFANQDECVSFGAQGGTIVPIVPKPTCTAGSDNFSDDAEFSVPTTWAGGTIEGPYGPSGNSAGILINGSSFNGDFADGAHVLFTGTTTAPFRLSFTQAVSSVGLDAESNSFDTFTLTLKAYDSSNALVDTDAVTTAVVGSLSVTSATNNISYFTLETNDPEGDGLAFTNIERGCAA